MRDALWSAIDAEYAEWDGAMGALDELHDRLIEYEVKHRFVSRSWRECVEALCADLGLAPDGNTWSDETRFAAPTGDENRAAGGRLSCRSCKEEGGEVASSPRARYT